MSIMWSLRVTGRRSSNRVAVAEVLVGRAQAVDVGEVPIHDLQLERRDCLKAGPPRRDVRDESGGELPGLPSRVEADPDEIRPADGGQGAPGA
jgi:hypothetical protein